MSVKTKKLRELSKFNIDIQICYFSVFPVSHNQLQSAFNYKMPLFFDKVSLELGLSVS